MAKLTRKSTTKKPASGGKSSQKSPSILAGAALAATTMLLLVAFASSIQSKTVVYVAKKPIAPYSVLEENMLKKVEVPSESVTDNDLTPAKFADYREDGKTLVNRVELYENQRLDQRSFSDSVVGSLSVVKPDERVIAITTSHAGVVGGAISPGAVADIISNGGSTSPLDEDGSTDAAGVLAENVKVLGIGIGDGAAAGLRPSGGTKIPGQKSGPTVGNGNIVVILAVTPQVASTIAAAATQNQLLLALNPHLKFDIRGEVCAIDECDNPEAQRDDDDSTDPTVDSETDPQTGTETDPTADPEAAGEQALPQDPVSGGDAEEGDVDAGSAR